MHKHFATLAIALLLLCGVLPSGLARADSSQGMLINEVQLDGATSKYEEFIELVNSSSAPIDITGWKLRVRNISGSECTVAKPFVVTFGAVTLAPNQTFLLASQKDTTQYFADKNPNMYYLPCSGSASVLAAEKVISLYDTSDTLVDSVTFSNLVTSTTLNPIAYNNVTQAGVSFERVLDPITGIPVDTNNSTQDFAPLSIPTPGVLAVLPPPVEPPPVEVIPPDPVPDLVPPTDTTAAETTPPPTDTTPTLTDPVIPTPEQTTPLLPITLNEVFIDPVSPQTDAQDEWVELYNPNDTAQDIGGYMIYSGETYSYHHTFAAGTTIPAKGYLVITSGESSLAFANGAGAVKLVSPSGVTVEVTTYESAPPGQAWAKDTDGVWKWTSTPTMAAQNIIFIPLPAVIEKAAVAAKKSSTKVATTKAATSTAKITKVAAAKTTKAKVVADEAPALVDAPSPLPIWLLAVLGTLAVLYSAYEYRFEVANKIYQLRRH